MPPRPDLVVVGAGFLGLSAALSYATARPGASVRVLTDEAEIGENAASSRTGGHILPGFAVGAHGLLARYGGADAEWLLRFAGDAVDHVLRAADARAIPTIIGHEDQDDVAGEAEALASLGYDAPLLDADALAAGGASGAAAGYRDPLTGTLRGEVRLRSLAAQCREAGVVIERAEVRRVVEETDGVRVETADGSFDADAAVCAAGPACPKLLGQDIHLAGFTTTSFRFDAPSETDPLAVCLSGMRVEYYWIEGGELRFGIRADPPPDEEFAAALAETRLGAAPGPLREVAQGRIWRREGGMPVVTVGPHVVAAYAFNGHGVALSHWIGHLAGLALSGDDVARTRLDRLAAILQRG
ncbi:FAD-dependent oxidoreductase [Rhodobacterales bacterium HKCCE3408]|nr:FAD-dependent oxidoreductase [Rhodobacterales bacterium HKCCE3408]